MLQPAPHFSPDSQSVGAEQVFPLLWTLALDPGPAPDTAFTPADMCSRTPHVAYTVFVWEDLGKKR